MTTLLAESSGRPLERHGNVSPREMTVEGAMSPGTEPGVQAGPLTCPVPSGQPRKGLRMQKAPSSGEFVIDFSALPLSEDLLRLVEDEKDEFEAVLGREVVFGRADGSRDSWTIEVPDSGTLPSVRWDSPTRLVSVAGSELDLAATMNALHSLSARDVEEVTVEPATSVEDAVDIITAEIAGTYPYFALRGLDWQEICDRHLEVLPDDSDFGDFAASWIAELGDAHTAIRTPGSGGFNPPYRGHLRDDGVHLSDVPEGSAAWEAGARPGWVVEIDDTDRLMRTVGASPQQVSQVRARRALAFHGERRRFTARDARRTREVEWQEAFEQPTLENVVDVGGSTDDRLVRVRAFSPQADVHSVFDELFAEGASSSRMTIDLRGNTGGSLLLATDLRDRFLRDRAMIGYAAFTDGAGGIGPMTERWADPSERSRWPGQVDIMIDAMTYSASEDFVLGLQGLDHVRVKGAPSGGGSGRPRRIPVLPGIDLTVSTCITYDRRRCPVEFRGIHPD